MISIDDYALPHDLAVHVADELRCHVDESNRLRGELAEALETIEALRFALATYRWTDGSPNP